MSPAICSAAPRTRYPGMNETKFEAATALSTPNTLSAVNTSTSVKPDDACFGRGTVDDMKRTLRDPTSKTYSSETGAIVSATRQAPPRFRKQVLRQVSRQSVIAPATASLRRRVECMRFDTPGNPRDKSCHVTLASV
jgi:hypothetical protein